MYPLCWPNINFQCEYDNVSKGHLDKSKVSVFFSCILLCSKLLQSLGILKQSCYHLSWLCWFNGYSWVILLLHVMLTGTVDTWGLNGLKRPEWPGQVAGSGNCLSAGNKQELLTRASSSPSWASSCALTSHCMAVRGTSQEWAFQKEESGSFSLRHGFSILLNGQGSHRVSPDSRGEKSALLLM